MLLDLAFSLVSFQYVPSYTRSWTDSRRVAAAYFTRDAAQLYWALLLRAWSRLFQPAQDLSPRSARWDHCATAAAAGSGDVFKKRLGDPAVGCSRGWREFIGQEAFDRDFNATSAVP